MRFVVAKKGINPMVCMYVYVHALMHAQILVLFSDFALLLALQGRKKEGRKEGRRKEGRKEGEEAQEPQNASDMMRRRRSLPARMEEQGIVFL
jgi:hypothetical protein